MKIAVLATFALLVVGGCANAPEEDCAGGATVGAPYVGAAVFDRCAGFSVAVDRTTYSIGDTLSLTLAFTSLFSGVGEITATFLPLEVRAGQQGVIVTEPNAAISGRYLWRLEADISKGGSVAPVRFVVRDNTPFHITATVRLTKVYDAAAEQLYIMGSDEQVGALGPLDHTAYGAAVPLQLPRPLD